MAGGGAGTDKRFDQRAPCFPAIHWIIREVLRDYDGEYSAVEDQPRPLCVSLSFSLHPPPFSFSRIFAIAAAAWIHLQNGIDLSTSTCRRMSVVPSLLAPPGNRFLFQIRRKKLRIIGFPAAFRLVLETQRFQVGCTLASASEN